MPSPTASRERVEKKQLKHIDSRVDAIAWYGLGDDHFSLIGGNCMSQEYITVSKWTKKKQKKP